jgi:hypothetical protein
MAYLLTLSRGSLRVVSSNPAKLGKGNDGFLQIPNQYATLSSSNLSPDQNYLIKFEVGMKYCLLYQ